MAHGQNVRKNHLNGLLPDMEFERIAPALTVESLRLGAVLYESGGQLRDVYFPTTAIISLLYVLADGRTAHAGARSLTLSAIFHERGTAP